MLRQLDIFYHKKVSNHTTGRFVICPHDMSASFFLRMVFFFQGKKKIKMYYSDWYR